MKIAFIGAGNMAEAIIAALLRRGAVGPGDILASDIREARLAEVARRHGIRVTGRNRAAVRHAPVVLLAVKPQQLDDVLAEIAGEVTA